ncbi:TPA: hypothetical protein ACH3X1_001162 [Trebouxia sp. C0004]
MTRCTVDTAAASPHVGQSDQKRSHEGNDNGTGKTQKRSKGGKACASYPGDKGRESDKPAFHHDGNKSWQAAMGLCFDCKRKQEGLPVSPMPAERAKSAKS